MRHCLKNGTEKCTASAYPQTRGIRSPPPGLGNLQLPKPHGKLPLSPQSVPLPKYLPTPGSAACFPYMGEWHQSSQCTQLKRCAPLWAWSGQVGILRAGTWHLQPWRPQLNSSTVILSPVHSQASVDAHRIGIKLHFYSVNLLHTSMQTWVHDPSTHINATQSL